MKRGRPKGKKSDSRSFGPLGDLIRKHRIEKGLGLADLATACDCSVQFISNIEHGRAPLPWYKIPDLSRSLGVSVEALQVANLSIRADFKSFFSLSPGATVTTKSGKRVQKPAVLKNVSSVASAVAIAARDEQLCEVISRYHAATTQIRKKFLRAAFELLEQPIVKE
jgi:transcriptional regulator with XRE-family HTH domain